MIDRLFNNKICIYLREGRRKMKAGRRDLMQWLDCGKEDCGKN